MMKLNGAVRRLRYALADRRICRQVRRVEAWLAERPGENGSQAPVLFFNASTRIHHLSLNGAFSLLASWAIRGRGVPVCYLVCRWGLEQCVLGTDWAAPEKAPPCDRCTRYSMGLFPQDRTIALEQDAAVIGQVGAELDRHDLEGLMVWSYGGLPLGELCLPGLRWALRRHHLLDDPPTRELLRSYLRSAASLADRFGVILDRYAPRAVVVFNGIMYPEAVARAIARRRGLPVITHEVGLKPYSAFFSHDHATFRQVDLPSDERLGQDQLRELESYLATRRRGQFSMAGVQFWPEMQSLPERIQSKLRRFEQLVSVFTNVIFDTSQIHANTLYPHMFAWLDDVLAASEAHPDTLFVIRAHPDEDRPGKASRESVQGWALDNRLDTRANVVFIPPGEYISSYELIERSKFVSVYNSSIGLEAAIMGAPVLCAGRARYTQVPTVRFPSSAAAHREQFAAWLRADSIEVPPEYRANARAFLFYELNCASLDFSAFLEPYPLLPGMVTFRDFPVELLDSSSALQAVRQGILEGLSFVLDSVPGAREA